MQTMKGSAFRDGAPGYKGLNSQQVERARAESGANVITHQKQKGFFRQYLANFGDPIIRILLIALAVNTLFIMKTLNFYESAGIAAAIFLATLVSTLSEYGSESAFQKLQEESARIKCRVWRSGQRVELPVAELVKGDTVSLCAGDRIPADGILLEGELDVDQSALNGESKEAHKSPDTSFFVPGEHKRGFQDPNRLFCGSVVCAGEGEMRIVSVGDKTFFGSLAREVQEEPRESPLKLRLGHLAGTISRVGYIGAFFVAVAYIFNSLMIDNGFQMALIAQRIKDFSYISGIAMNAITLAMTVIVVAVPEGLPMMITVVLSSNMKRMLKDNVLVRKLVGIETSGSVNVLFTDKTGTLTKGQLRVKTFISGDNQEYTDLPALRKHQPLWELVRVSALYNTAASLSQQGKHKVAIGGNATERALLDYVGKYAADPSIINKIKSIPFDSAKKYSAAEIRTAASHCTFIKGAPEKILPYCTTYYDENGQKRTFAKQSHLQHSMMEAAKQAVRLIALATSDAPLREEMGFQNLTLVGIVGIRDEIRKEAVGGIRQVQRAGIQVVMITGDSRETAVAIARELGLVKHGPAEAVMTSDQMGRLSDSELKARLPGLRVVARALPSDKSRLVRLAQACGLVVGMTGDGVNDAPALKKADVGFAMGSGTEVAKEAGDIVILDDNFLSISRAILYGRTIFKSIRKFIIFQLTVNLCAVGISIIGPFIGIDTPVTVIQMLWINMVMDTLAGLAFGGEAPLKEYMNEKPKKREEKIINSYMWNEILFTGVYTAILCVLFLKMPAIRGLFREAPDNRYLMTGFFAFFMFAGVFNSFNARTHRLNLLAHLWRNKAFITVMGLVAFIQILLIYYGGSLFRTVALTPAELRVSLIIAATVVPVDWIRKILLHFQKEREMGT